MSTAAAPEGRPGHCERVVTVQEAKTSLSSLLREVEAGSVITISRGSTAVARLVPIEQSPEAVRRRPKGFLRFSVPDSFFEDLPEAELQAWEGGEWPSCWPTRTWCSASIASGDRRPAELSAPAGARW